MTDLYVEGSTLTASEDQRVISGLLSPFHEQGRSNLGLFSVDPGTITVPKDIPNTVGLNVEHKRENPVGRALSVAELPTGMFASFRVADGPDGDAALADAKSGKRTKLSAEIRDCVIRNGKLISGTLFGAALVEAGAFPSAGLLLAADVGNLNADVTPPAALDPVDGVLNIVATTTPDEVVVHPTDGEPVKFTPETEPPVADATAPNTLTAGRAVKRGPSLYEIGNLLFAARMGTLDADGMKVLTENNADTMFGALSDVKYDGTGGLAPTIGQPQWIGEIWSALKYNQQVLPLFSHADLTSMNWAGFSWTTKPAGGDWAGNKGNVPSNTLVVAPVTGTAGRYAIGHDIAREFVDFNVPGFFESYAAAVTEDYARWADGKVGTAITAGATALAADALTTLPGPTGGTIGSAASAIIDGAAALVTLGTLPSFALVAPALWKQMAKMPSTNVLGYLNASLGLSEGDLEGFVIRPSASVAAGKVLVGAREAVTVYELPGVPIRVDALDLARGGVDKAAFGYLGVNINDARGLQLVTAATS